MYLYTLLPSQGEHLRLVPLSATASPNISSDEHTLSDAEASETLSVYSLGRFVPSSKQGGSSSSVSTIGAGSQPQLPSHAVHKKVHRKVGSSTPVIKRRVTHSAATSNLLAEMTDHGSFASAEDTPPPSGHSSPMPPSQPSTSPGRGHKPLSPQRSNTFSAPNKSKCINLQQQMVSYSYLLSLNRN